MKQITYTRRCDECRRDYQHTRGASTGWCNECERRIHELATAPVPEPTNWRLPPLIEVFER